MKNLLAFFWIVAVMLFTILTIRMFYLFQSDELDAMMKLLVPYAVVISAILASTSVFLSVENTNMIEGDRKQEEKEKNKIILSALLDTIFIKSHTIKIPFEKIDIETAKDNPAEQFSLYEKEYQEMCSNLSFAFSNMSSVLDKLYDKDIYYSLDIKSQKALNGIIASTITLLNLKDDILLIQSQPKDQESMFYTELVKIQDLYEVYEQMGISLLKRIDAQNSVFLNKADRV